MTDKQSEQILQAIKELNDQMNEGFRKVDQRFEEVDRRFEAMDKRFDKMDQRFDNMETRQQKMQNSIDILARRGLDNEADIIGIKKAIGQQ